MATKEAARLLDGYIAGIAAGDMQALCALYEETRSAAYGFALSYLRRPFDAEDVLQETYIRIHASAASYTSQGKPLAWILTIVRRLALMKLREREKTAALSEEEWVADSRQIALTEEDRLVLARVMEELKEEERRVVLLHAVAGFRHREIAELLELPLPTVLSKYHRAIKKLREQWIKEEAS